MTPQYEKKRAQEFVQTSDAIVKFNTESLRSFVKEFVYVCICVFTCSPSISRR